ncbi:MAG: tRNA lysidine(34) synthetase TilS [Holosporales bacterium]|jgi:tRNA(Ile)-lysidine synthase|nr:tRNA lysidine(34) synthetase TilS [Holosporales bacterium]
MLISDELFSEKIPEEIREKKIWAVGLSGGADSLCLTMLTNNYAKLHNIDIFACIVDHKLRKESSTEILPIIEILRNNNIKYEVLVWEHPKNIGGNIELKARVARYNLLYDFCKEIACETLMTAHHAFDQWETFFMRLSRGSSIRGLSCIKYASEFKDIMLVRPLLDFTPFDIRETLEKRFGIKKYVFDPSNNDPRFERTKWRNAYCELSEKYNLNVTNVNKTVRRIQRANDCLEEIARRIASEIFNGVYIEIKKFKELPCELKIRVLNIIVNATSPKKQHIVSYSLLERIAEDICQKEFVATNLSGIVLKKDCSKNVRVYVESRKR